MLFIILLMIFFSIAIVSVGIMFLPGVLEAIDECKKILKRWREEKNKNAKNNRH